MEKKRSILTKQIKRSISKFDKEPREGHKQRFYEKLLWYNHGRLEMKI